METGVTSPPWSPGKKSIEWVRKATRAAARKEKNDQVARQISTGKLNTLLRLHTRPIKVVVCNLPSVRLTAEGNLILEEAWRLDAFSAYPFRT